MATINKTTVDNVDLKRFMGTWYEIARFNHRFERGLQGVTAEYTLKENGKIQVKNCGHKQTLQGEKTCSVGKAHPSRSGQPGQLRVAFFLFFYSDYNIMELDPDYQWALIGSSSDKYLWILSRTPHLSPETTSYILGKARSRGYDITKLLFIQQP